MHALIAAWAVAWLTAGPIRADEDEPVPLSELPKAVVAAIKMRFPKAELVEAEKETENGKTVYDVSIKDGDTNIDVTLTPDGVITMIEREIAAKDLPKAVREALARRFPNGKITEIDEVIVVKQGRETVDYYDAVVTTAKGKMLEVEVGPNGKIRSVEEVKE